MPEWVSLHDGYTTTTGFKFTLWRAQKEHFFMKIKASTCNNSIYRQALGACILST